MRERIDFLKKFIQNPMKIGSLTPSSHFLTKKMFVSLQWDGINSIVELGAGTGRFTEYIVSHKKEACRFIAFERDSGLRTYLEKKYPETIFGGQAENLSSVLARHDIHTVDCIISGLPFAVFPQEKRLVIM